MRTLRIEATFGTSQSQFFSPRFKISVDDEQIGMVQKISVEAKSPHDLIKIFFIDHETFPEHGAARPNIFKENLNYAKLLSECPGVEVYLINTETKVERPFPKRLLKLDSFL